MKRILKKQSILITSLFLFSGVIILTQCTKSAPQLGKTSIKDVIGAMTLGERHPLW
ncbi:MAG: hypothetical protein JW944_04360 [Deltaproteobacteria bacterium]|nr:hypothetical protein [Deltaproteobacteria bacterium]